MFKFSSKDSDHTDLYKTTSVTPVID